MYPGSRSAFKATPLRGWLASEVSRVTWIWCLGLSLEGIPKMVGSLLAPLEAQPKWESALKNTSSRSLRLSFSLPLSLFCFLSLSLLMRTVQAWQPLSSSTGGRSLKV